MVEYLRAQKETNEAIINSAFNGDELRRFSKSDFRWVKNKGKSYHTRKIKKAKYISSSLARIILRRCLMNIED